MIYLDHQIIACERNWPLIRDIISHDSGGRLAVSQYNLIEIAGGTDRPQVIRRAELIDSLQPIWIRERLDIQNQEMRCFLWDRYFHTTADSVRPFSSSLSAVLAYYLGTRTPLACSSASRWMGSFANNLHLDEPRAINVKALKTLQDKGPQKLKSTEGQAFREWALPRIPYRDPADRPIREAERHQLADFCYANRTDFLTMCRSMAVEDILCDIRTRDRNRLPKMQDALDLQHSIVALAYCDNFVTEDRYVYHYARQAKRRLSRARTASIYKSLHALAAVTLPADP